MIYLICFSFLKVSFICFLSSLGLGLYRLWVHKIQCKGCKQRSSRVSRYYSRSECCSFNHFVTDCSTYVGLVIQVCSRKQGASSFSVVTYAGIHHTNPFALFLRNMLS